MTGTPDPICFHDKVDKENAQFQDFHFPCREQRRFMFVCVFCVVFFGLKPAFLTLFALYNNNKNGIFFFRYPPPLCTKYPHAKSAFLFITCTGIFLNGCVQPVGLHAVHLVVGALVHAVAFVAAEP